VSATVVFPAGFPYWSSNSLNGWRISRNEAGHPTGKSILREDQYISLQMFGRYIHKLYDLKAFFLQSSGEAG
jgi:hypothetical protein